MKKRALQGVISLILILCIPMSVHGTTIAELKEQQKETQKQLDATNSNINSLTEQKKGITAEIEEIDDQLVEVMASVSMLEDEIEEIKGRISDKKDEIAVKTAEYEEAKATEEAQYEAMKKRIKFMYERGDYTYVQLLVEAKNLSDLVNKTEYIEKLYEYDRKMLIKFQEIKQAVADAKAALEAEQQELEEQEDELNVSLEELGEEKASLDELMEQKKAEEANYETAISKAKQDAAAYKARIKQQNSEIRRLEAEEAAKKAAAEAATNSKSSSSSSTKKGSSYNLDSASVISSSSGSASGKEIASYACKFVGNPYVAGGTSLTDGCDCSGFTSSVYREFGYSIPRTSTAQRSAGRGVNYSEAQPGDIICYAGHVGIYIGNGQIVHASSPSTGIRYTNATYKEILAVRRIVD